MANRMILNETAWFGRGAVGALTDETPWLSEGADRHR